MPSAAEVRYTVEPAAVMLEAAKEDDVNDVDTVSCAMVVAGCFLCCEAPGDEDDGKKAEGTGGAHSFSNLVGGVVDVAAVVAVLVVAVAAVVTDTIVLAGIVVADEDQGNCLRGITEGLLFGDGEIVSFPSFPSRTLFLEKDGSPSPARAHGGLSRGVSRISPKSADVSLCFHNVLCRKSP